jgi:hypothetical protein
VRVPETSRDQRARDELWLGVREIVSRRSDRRRVRSQVSKPGDVPGSLRAMTPAASGYRQNIAWPHDEMRV